MKRIMYFTFVVLISLFLSSCNCNCSNNYKFYKNAKAYQEGSFSYQAIDVYSEISINWIAGKITLVESENDVLNVIENSSGLNKSEQVHYLIEQGKLTMHYAKSGYFGRIDDQYKELLIEVPKGIVISIHTISANIDCERLESSKLDVDSVSAYVNIDFLKANRLDISTISGNITIHNLDTTSFDIDTVSGQVRLGIRTKLTGEIDTISGNIHLHIQEDLGFKVEFDSISGEFNSTLPYTSNGNIYQTNIVNEIDLEIDSTSANVYIEGE